MRWPTRFGAVRTPEVFVLDRERTIRYRGRIDDQYVVGRQRPQPTRRDLAVAFEELLAGKAPSVAETAAIGCQIGRVPKQAPTGDVTYSNQIARLLQNAASNAIAPGEIAPFPLTSYDEVVGWAEMIREVVDEGRMPPWFANPEHGQFANDARLSDEEKQLDLRLARQRLPRRRSGRLASAACSLPSAGRFPSPTRCSTSSDEPYDVPAEGVVAYQYFKVDPGFTEDKWIQAAEAGPATARSCITSWRSSCRPGGETWRRSARRMIGYAPGMPPSSFPDGDGDARSGRLEARFPDALHAQRHAAEGPQLRRA